MTVRKLWGIGPREEDSLLNSEEEIRAYLNCHPVVARLLWNRGLRSTQQVDAFMRPDLSKLPDPLSIIDMEKAVGRVAEAVANEEQIAIYGDYDVDGTCGLSILTEFLRGLGVEPLTYQPNRFTEGYGVHSAAVEALIEAGARVIITVDCGITAIDPARVARERGVDMVILDHHKVGAELPAATAVVDPQRPEDQSGLLNLCGAGLAFFFAMALRARLRDEGFFEATGTAEPNLMKLLDLVAIATVADIVDIRGVNRILVAYGLRVMNKNPRPGIRALLQAAKIERASAMHCGFILGPRINAAGRIRSAQSAFELLTCADHGRAQQLAAELERINTTRRQAQESVFNQAREQALSQLNDPRWQRLAETATAAAAGPWPRALVLAAPAPEPASADEAGWHEGVVGIVASKIVEEFGRPVFVLACREGDSSILKGSVRSFSKIDILAAISTEHVARHLINFGGHAFAGGVTLERAQLESFTEALNLHLATVTTEEHFRRERRFDAEVRLEEINGRLVEELQLLEPYGHEFPEPVFKIINVSPREVTILKEKHLKMRFHGAFGMEGVWFNAFREEKVLTEMDRIRAGGPCALYASPQWNEWQGTKRLQLQIKHAELL